MMLTCSSCSLTDSLNNAAETQAQIRAGIILPDWPADCRAKEPHAAVSMGDELRAVLRREQAALDRQNARTGRCGDFYDNVKTKFGAR
jgi:hypothetical protein